MAIDLWRTRPFTSNPMRRAVDGLFEEAFAPFSGGRDGGAASSSEPGVQTLPVTLWETSDAFHAALMAPGLDENSLTVTVQDDTLSVEGEMKFQPPEGAETIWQEFGPTSFRRAALRNASGSEPSGSGLAQRTAPDHHAQIRSGQAAPGARSRGTHRQRTLDASTLIFDAYALCSMLPG
jgi:HSP20 family molecular chaperone IbpA